MGSGFKSDQSNFLEAKLIRLAALAGMRFIDFFFGLVELCSALPVVPEYPTKLARPLCFMSDLTTS
jgi:hypothetical protein